MLQWRSFLVSKMTASRVSWSVCMHVIIRVHCSSRLFVSRSLLSLRSECHCTVFCLLKQSLPPPPAQPALIFACCTGTRQGAPPHLNGPTHALDPLCRQGRPALLTDSRGLALTSAKSSICFLMSRARATSLGWFFFFRSHGQHSGICVRLLMHVVIFIILFDLPTLTTLYSKGLPPLSSSSYSSSSSSSPLLCLLLHSRTDFAATFYSSESHFFRITDHG